MQAWYGYQFSGKNLPPFGCLRTDNTTPALDLRFDLFDVVSAYSGSIDTLPGVGLLAIICNDTY